MTAAAVLYDLAAAGVTIAAQGDRLRFWPRSAVGLDLLTRLRDHKAELLAILQAEAVPPGDDREHDDAGPGWDDLQDAAEIPGCPTCPRLTTWQDALGRWRCGTCDPSERSRRLADRVDRLRHLAAVRAAVTKGSGSFPQTIADAPFGNGQITTQSLATPDPRIIADPVAMCPRCRSVRVLPELRTMTGGWCWSCHLATVPGGEGDILPARRS